MTMQHRSLAQWLVLSVVCVAGGLTTRDSLAGSKANHFVSISGLTAQGSLGGARNSADSVQQIGCSIHQGSIGGLAHTDDVHCIAVTAAGAVLGCFTTNQEFFHVVDSINST